MITLTMALCSFGWFLLAVWICPDVTQSYWLFGVITGLGLAKLHQIEEDEKGERGKHA
jgi:hypothetical protein